MLKGKLRLLMFVILLLLLSGCAAKRAFLAGEESMQQGQFDTAVEEYSTAVKAAPDVDEYRIRLIAAKAQAAKMHLNQGRQLMANARFADAAQEFSVAVSLDPNLEVARNEMGKAQQRLQVEYLVDEAEAFYAKQRLNQARSALDQALELEPDNLRGNNLLAKLQAQGTLLDGYELHPDSTEPITLKFKDAKIQDVFNILTQLSGINFIFDEDVRPDKISVYLEDATFSQALELLLNMKELGKKVLNPKTIIIYPKNKDKDKQYEDQVIQTFYLSNIDAKKAVNLLRTMLQLRKIYVHEELNALIVRDTPDVIELCRSILEAADLGDSEVLYDVEIVEVSHGDDWKVGAKLGSYSISGGLGTGGTIVRDTLSSGNSTTNLVNSFSSLESFYTLPTASFEFAKSLSDAEILAKPKIRVKNHEKAKVHIGSREPVITVTTTGDTTSDNIQYVDVGVKLDVEPTIQLDDTVLTKLTLEVSSVSDRNVTTNGSLALTITTTNAQTSLTLRDGEQTVIGGLLRDDLAKSKTTIPLIGDIPVLGDMLSYHTKEKQKREILLSITPHIVKNLRLPEPKASTIWSGGEDNLKAGPNFGAFIVNYDDKKVSDEKTTAPSGNQPGQQEMPTITPIPNASGELQQFAVPEDIPQQSGQVSPGLENGPNGIPPSTQPDPLPQEFLDDLQQNQPANQ